MTIADWSCCPSCKMCANYSHFKKVLEADPTCPMCAASVPPMSLKLSSDPAGDFKTLVNLFKEPAAADEDEEGSRNSDEDDAALLA